jgi:hypothetical protein
MNWKPLYWLAAAVLALAFADPVLRALDGTGVSSIRFPPVFNAIDAMVVIALALAAFRAILERRRR